MLSIRLAIRSTIIVEGKSVGAEVLKTPKENLRRKISFSLGLTDIFCKFGGTTNVILIWQLCINRWICLHFAIFQSFIGIVPNQPGQITREHFGTN